MRPVEGVEGVGDLDQDLEVMDRDWLVAEVRRLRSAIRRHHDCSGMDLCWYHPGLWDLLPESAEVRIEIPEWPQFLRGCVRYRQSLDEQLPDATRTTDEYELP